MSQSPRAGLSAFRGSELETTVSDNDTLETMLGALEDEDCRTILEATSDDSLTASEISEECDLALSTAYRKLDILTDADLLEEQIRLSRSGKHTSEYVRSVEDIQVSMGAEGIELHLTHRSSPEAGTSLVAGAD